MTADHWILLGAWALFGIEHSLMASDWFVSHCKSVMGDLFRYYRLLYSGIALLSLAAVLLWQFSLPPIVLDPPHVLRWMPGLPAGIVGILLMGRCVLTYFRVHSGIGALYRKSHEPVLILKGVHRHVRHPLYLGTLLVIWSLFLFFPLLANLITCGMITLYTLVGIRLEERKLLCLFGETYADYRQQTPMLIPRIRQRKAVRRIKTFFQL